RHQDRAGFVRRAAAIPIQLRLARVTRASKNHRTNGDGDSPSQPSLLNIASDLDRRPARSYSVAPKCFDARSTVFFLDGIRGRSREEARRNEAEARRLPWWAIRERTLARFPCSTSAA